MIWCEVPCQYVSRLQDCRRGVAHISPHQPTHPLVCRNNRTKRTSNQKQHPIIQYAMHPTAHMCPLNDGMIDPCACCQNEFSQHPLDCNKSPPCLYTLSTYACLCRRCGKQPPKSPINAGWEAMPRWGTRARSRNRDR